MKYKSLVLAFLASLSFLGCQSTGRSPSFGTVPMALPGGEEEHLANNKKLAKGLEKEITQNFTLLMALKLAFQRNPRIQAARANWKSAIEKIPQASSYPEPMVSFTHYFKEVETRVGPQKQAFSVSQKIPFPGKLSLKGSMAEIEAEIQRLKTEETIRNVLADTKIAYAELFYIRRIRRLYQKQKELIERYLAFAAKEHGKGKVKAFELFKAQSFLAQIGYEEIVLQEMEISQTQILLSLLNLSPGQNLGKIEAPPFSELKTTLKEFIDFGEKGNEELAMALNRVRKAQVAYTLSKMVYLPDFQVGGKWINTGKALVNTPDNGKDPLMITVGMNLPIWFPKNMSAVSEAYSKLERNKQIFLGVKQRLRAQIAKVYFNMTNSERLVKLYSNQLIPQARQAMVSAERSYREGITGFAGVLETTSVWLNFQLAYFRALVDYFQHRATMEKLIGRVIP